MSSIGAEEWELLAFFGVEHQRLDSSIPWVYDESNHQIKKRDFSLLFSIQPSCKDVRINLKLGKQSLFEL